MNRCGARARDGLCELPEGHNRGRADVPENHDSLRPTPDPYVEEADANPERANNGCMIYKRGA